MFQNAVPEVRIDMTPARVRVGSGSVFVCVAQGGVHTGARVPYEELGPAVAAFSEELAAMRASS